MSLNNSTYTQSLGIPFTQYVTSSAGHALVSSSTYFNDTSDNLPRYKDAVGNVLVPLVSSSYAVTASYALSSPGGADTNFANTDLTFTGFRTHDTNGNGFIIAADGVGISGPYMGMTLQDLGMGATISSSYIGVSDTTITAGVNSVVIKVQGTSSIVSSATALNINSANKDHDVVIEGVTDTTLFVTDAATDRVGIGKSSPNAKLDVNGDTTISGSLTVSGSVHKFDGNVVSNDILQVTNTDSNISAAGTFTPAGGNRAALLLDGTLAVTLANGTTGGILYIYCSAEIAPGTTTITPTNAQGFASLAFNAIGDTATLMWMGSDWYLLSSHNVTVS